MKIKRQVEMNEKELIKYLVDHDNTTIRFSGISYDGAWLSIEPEIESKVHFEFKDASTFEKTFTVTVEEEITEDTLFHHIIEITKDDTHLTWKHTNITEEKDSTSKEFHAYIDGEYKLIWRDGKLIKE